MSSTALTSSTSKATALPPAQTVSTLDFATDEVLQAFDKGNYLEALNKCRFLIEGFLKEANKQTVKADTICKIRDVYIICASSLLLAPRADSSLKGKASVWKCARVLYKRALEKTNDAPSLAHSLTSLTKQMEGATFLEKDCDKAIAYFLMACLFKTNKQFQKALTMLSNLEFTYPEHSIFSHKHVQNQPLLMRNSLQFAQLKKRCSDELIKEQEQQKTLLSAQVQLLNKRKFPDNSLAHKYSTQLGAWLDEQKKDVEMKK